MIRAWLAAMLAALFPPKPFEAPEGAFCLLVT